MNDLLGYCSTPKADVVSRCAALQCVQRTLSQQPQELTLHPERSAQLAESIRSLPPSGDHSLTAYWIRALVEAHVSAVSSGGE